MERAVQRYLRHHRANGASPHTLRWHNDALSHLLRFMRERGYPTGIDDLDVDHVREWVAAMQERGLSQSSVATRVRSVKAFTRWLVSEDWLPKDPLAKLKRPKVDDTPKDTLPPEDVDRLLASCNRKTLVGCRDFAIMVLLFSTGLRAAELMALRVEDIDWGQGLIMVRRGKGGKFRVVPLGAAADRALDRYLSHPKRAEHEAVFLSRDGNALTRSALRCILHRRGRTAGVHCNPHKWRHSAAITYLRSGGRVEHLKAMLGHSRLDQTLHYARIAGVDLTTAHETADPTRSLKTRV